MLSFIYNVLFFDENTFDNVEYEPLKATCFLGIKRGIRQSISPILCDTTHFLHEYPVFIKNMLNIDISWINMESSWFYTTSNMSETT
jgi:purine-nucleoside phosphorylase